MIKARLAKYAAWIVAILVAAAIAAVVTWVISYGEARYKEGREAERVEWVTKVLEAETRAREAERQYAAEVIRRNEAIRERDAARARHLTQTREEIQNAPDTETRYAAYAEFDRSMRESAAARRADAWADYLSTVAPAGGGAAGSAGPELFLPAK